MRIAMLISALTLASTTLWADPTGWSASSSYGVGAQVIYQGKTYQALQAHTAQLDWTPVATPALWQLVAPGMPTTGCPAWQEGLTYQVGASVSYNSKYYVALQMHTAYVGTGWNPAATPALWQAVANCPTPTLPTSEVINGVTVPPDPGAAGKQTLQGIDADGDGVRDDVQRFLAQQYGDDLKTYNSAKKVAISLQKEIEVGSGNDREAARKQFNQYIIAMACLRQARGDVNNYSRSEQDSKVNKKLFALVDNTPARLAAANHADDLSAGMVFMGINENKLICE